MLIKLVKGFLPWHIDDSVSNILPVVSVLERVDKILISSLNFLVNIFNYKCDLQTKNIRI